MTFSYNGIEFKSVCVLSEAWTRHVDNRLTLELKIAGVIDTNVPGEPVTEVSLREEPEWAKTFRPIQRRLMAPRKRMFCNGRIDTHNTRPKYLALTNYVAVFHIDCEWPACSWVNSPST